MSNLPFVSVVIPCRNEEKFIGACLDSIIINDYPKDKLEILVVDGISNDRTRKILEKYSKECRYIKILDNLKKIIPVAMNIGIGNAKGEIIMKMDGHATYQKNYVSRCVEYLNEYSADNVGGIWKIVPRENTPISKAIALALSGRFGSGDAYIKIGSKKPRWSDSVSFGCFKKGIFKKIGLFNEKLIRGSDMDFNKRIKKAGGKILLVPDIVTNYYADANFKSSWRHNYSDGFWTTHVLKFGSNAFSVRHLIPLFFVLNLILSALLSFVFFPFLWLFLSIIGAYSLASIVASANILVHTRQKDARYLFLLPAAFLIRHTAHGIGALFGLIIPRRTGK
ncbi:MAG: glycosyltransferase family 2 protein [Candidatus Paceibacterota bacterium]